MVHPFRFGVQTGPFDDPVALREFAKKIECLGYAELFSYDHIGDVDPFLPLLVGAEATTTLRFGPLVLNNEFHNPVLLARTAATFDLLTDGRLLLGMGTGYMQAEHDASDILLRAPGPRVSRFEESVVAVRQLLNEGSWDCEGEHITLAIDDLGVRTAQAHVPLVIGGHGHRVVSIAGRHADLFQFTGLTHDPETGKPSGGGFSRDIIMQRRAWLQTAAADRFADIELSTLVQATKVGSGADEARSGMAGRMGVETALLDDTPFALFGSEAQVIDKLHGLRDELGIHHIVCRDADDFAPIVTALAGT